MLMNADSGDGCRQKCGRDLGDYAPAWRRGTELYPISWYMTISDYVFEIELMIYNSSKITIFLNIVFMQFSF